jgi:hypothetical protein
LAVSTSVSKYSFSTRSARSGRRSEMFTSCSRRMNGIVHPLSIMNSDGFSRFAESQRLYCSLRAPDAEMPARAERWMSSESPASWSFDSISPIMSATSVFAANSTVLGSSCPAARQPARPAPTKAVAPAVFSTFRRLMDDLPVRSVSLDVIRRRGNRRRVVRGNP